MAQPRIEKAIAERDQRLLLADTLDGDCAEILSRWLTRVEADLATGGQVEPAQLRDAMPDYLHSLAASLRGEAPSLLEQGEASWKEIAREHALARVRLGFNVDQLVHEFIVLRRVIAEITAERNGDETIPSTQGTRIAELIEAAIASAVRSYVEARDYEARRREAEHISFITHELRNPLSAVKLAVARARRCREAEQQQRTLDVLERNVDRIAALIDGVLQVERLQAGKVEPQFREMTLGELLEGPIDNAKMGAEAKGLALDTSFDPDLPVRVDADLATSAISNVLDNAVKYTDAGSVCVVAEVTPGSVCLHVRDNCPGLSQEELSVIFEPFERARTKKPGSGLGLAIARRALEVQGGSIDAESTEDRGCHFWLTLPRAAH